MEQTLLSALRHFYQVARPVPLSAVARDSRRYLNILTGTNYTTIEIMGNGIDSQDKMSTE